MKKQTHSQSGQRQTAWTQCHCQGGYKGWGLFCPKQDIITKCSMWSWFGIRLGKSYKRNSWDGKFWMLIEYNVLLWNIFLSIIIGINYVRECFYS